MICPYCGRFKQISLAMRTRLKEKGKARTHCPGCGSLYEVVEDDENSNICPYCGKNEIEEGLKVCWECYSRHRQNQEIMNRRRAVEKEREERGKPEEGLDEVAIKAKEHGMSYGKYLSERYAGRV